MSDDKQNRWVKENIFDRRKSNPQGDRWKDHGMNWAENHRICVKCGEVKSFSEFHKHKSCMYGINTVCILCRVLISKQSWKSKPIEKKIYSRAKSRATKKGMEFNIEIDDIVIPKVCPVFNVPFESSGIYTPSIDRHDSRKGYVKGNIVIMSTRANTLKNNGTISEFMMLVRYLEFVK